MPRSHEAQEHSFHHGRSNGRANVADLRPVADQTAESQRLAAQGVVFDAAYCNSPLCAPSRFTLVSGQLPSKIGAYDNAADFPADVPTYAHYLRRLGYRTALSGKMHFCGPDQLHGYEERLTSDIYPADYGWAVNWDEPDVRPSWYHNMSSVLQAGPCVRTNQLDFDEEVVFKAQQYLFDHIREDGDQPFCLTVSMTHPHDPYTIPKAFWDLYDDAISRCLRRRINTISTRIRNACSRSMTCGTSRCLWIRSATRAAPTSVLAAISTATSANSCKPSKIPG
jgi:choline-sulfatase